MQKIRFFVGSIALILFICSKTASAQCTTQVTHLTGTQQVGCTEVTVTSEGSAGNLTICGKGPYLIGNLGPGAYTFTFAPAITGITFGVYALNNNLLGFEEIALTINGNFYAVTNPGVDDGCLDEAVISGTGTIQACANCASSWDDIVVTENITTLKIEDIYLAGGPAGALFSLYICCPACPTDAGTITADPLAFCDAVPATVPPAGQTFLQNDDLLQYVLFSNPSDTVGSILAISNTPTFTFNPSTMQTGVTYYIAAMAGNNLNGNVDQNDPCLDFSNAIPVIWWPKPAITLSIANPDVCAGDCTDVTATMTGTPPFIFTYTTPFSGTLSETFTTNTGTFEVCPPVGTPLGNLNIQVTALVDVNCRCD